MRLTQGTHLDLILVRDMFIQRLGPDFARSALRNNDGHVSQRVRSLLIAVIYHHSLYFEVISPNASVAHRRGY